MVEFIILTGPSGVGKTTLIDRLLSRYGKLRRFLSYTTRVPRDGEVNGLHYNFVTTEVFEAMINNGEFFEWKRVYGDYKGIANEEFEDAMETGHVLIRDIDVQGALDIKQRLGGKVLTIYVTVPSIKDILARNSDETRLSASRIETFNHEESLSNEFDYIIVNKDLSKSMRELESVMRYYFNWK